MKIHYQSVFDKWDMEDKSVQALITSPPYYSLRKYDIPDVIMGGEKDCKHEWMKSIPNLKPSNQGIGSNIINPNTVYNETLHKAKVGEAFSCIYCKAWKGQHGLEPSFTSYLSHCKLWMQEAIRVLKDDGVIFVNLADSYFNDARGGIRPSGKTSCVKDGRYNGNIKVEMDYPIKSRLLIPERFAIMCVDELGLILRNHIVWYKPNGMPESCQDRFSKKWESIFMFTKQEKYYFDLDAVREEHAEATKQRVKYPTGMNQKYKDNDIGQPKGTFEHILEKGKNPGDVFNIPTSPSPERHFAMWPEALVRRMILCSTKPGDTVLDPFCGSGTTLRVADKLNRIGLGIELGYKEIQEKRLSEIQKELILA